MLVEDHRLVRAGLRMLIESRPDMIVVGEAADSAHALEIATREHPVIILLDLDLGPERGLDLLSALKSAAPPVRIVILTGVRQIEEHRQALGHGAVGLVLKEQAPEVLLKAIEKVHDGEVWIERTMLASMITGMASGSAKPVNVEAGRIAMLTEREREVSALVGQGLKNKQIGERLSITETTVGHHLTSIFDKLGVESRLELVIFAHRHGLSK
jgi:DNA-binding NarL/FixJ family response regulator